MKSFVISCLLAASVLSVSTRVGGMNLIQKEAEEKEAEPELESAKIEVAEKMKEDDDSLLEEVTEENDLDIDIDFSLMPVETAEEQIEAVAEQVKQGFTKI